MTAADSMPNPAGRLSRFWLSTQSEVTPSGPDEDPGMRASLSSLPGHLDLHDAGAHVGEQLASRRANHRLPHLDDASSSSGRVTRALCDEAGVVDCAQ